MQILYALNRDKTLDFDQAKNSYRRSIDLSYKQYLFILLQLIALAKYNKKDSEKRTTKHLPTEEDLAFKPKFYELNFVQELLANKALLETLEDHAIANNLNDNTTRLLYNGFSEQEEFKQLTFGTQPISETDVLLGLLKFFTSNENFVDHIDDEYSSWYDDKSLILGAVKKTFKSNQGSGKFLRPICLLRILPLILVKSC